MSDDENMKVEYHLLKDYGVGRRRTSTAYLDTDHGDDVWSGVNKHTDQPVTVFWDGKAWYERPGAPSPPAGGAK